MGKWTYTLLNFLFFVPVLWYAWSKYKVIIRKERKFIFITALCGLILFFLVDPVATSWGAWSYDYSQTFNVRIGYSVVEELVWAVLLSTVMGIAVAVGANHDERKHPHK